MTSEPRPESTTSVGPGRLGVVVGDVSGKAISGALFMALAGDWRG